MVLQQEMIDWDEVPALSVRGRIHYPLVAIVGTRKPSEEAAEAAFAVAKLLAGVGVGVVSGLALGIDAAAHRGCIAGGGSTVAVLGHGLEAPLYPPQHKALAGTIAKRGALVSPFPADYSLSRRSLLARNKWIAGLAKAVWVVQSGLPGGALTAAAYARQLEIPVLATPWPDENWQKGYESLVNLGVESVDVISVANRLEELCYSGRRPIKQGRLSI